MTGKGLPKGMLVSAAVAFLAISYGTPTDVLGCLPWDVARMFPTFTIWPGTPYDDQYNDPDATGLVTVIQPNRRVDVVIGVVTRGLIPNTLYLVKFDTNGNGTTWDSRGPWTPSMGTFTTDAEGRGTWTYAPPAGTYAPGVYTWSVFINLASAGRSILVSKDIVFEIRVR